MFNQKTWYSLFSRQSFFGNIDQLEEGCLRVHVEVGDILVMPANYLHFVLTKGDAVSLGTNFLAMGHLPMIKESMILEYAKNANDMFPGLPEMLVLMMHQLVVDLHPASADALYPRTTLCDRYTTIMKSSK